MTHLEFYQLIHLPEGAINQLNQYEKQRKGEIPAKLREKLFSRETWDEGVKELQEFRIGSLEYEFVEVNHHREVEVHIPSDADMTLLHSYRRFSIEQSKSTLLLMIGEEEYPSMVL